MNTSDPDFEAKATEPQPEAAAKTPSDLTPQLVKRVHELYAQLGLEEVRAVQEWELRKDKSNGAESKPAAAEPKPEAKAADKLEANGAAPTAEPKAAEAKPQAKAAEPKPAPPPPTPAKRKQNRTRTILIGVVVLVLIAAITVYYIRFIAPYESTDDAFIEGHVTIVSPQVSGRVARLLIHDNQEVKEGDPLLEIDPRDYNTKLAQARADLTSAQSQLEQAKAQVVVDEAKAAQQLAAVTVAEAESARAGADLKRYQAVEIRAISRTQLDLQETQAKSTAANVEEARQQAKAAEAQVDLSRVNIKAAAAGVQQAEAKMEQAQLDVSYTKITAPVDGRVTQRSVEKGAYVQTGQSLLALVPTNVWIVANFKETQLARMRPGQPVTIKVDAYSNRHFKGRVDSLQSGSGAQFSLLPPENAVGNYVKVVQRVPVKIIFDEPLDPQLDIAPGMSVEPEVKVK
jgi:membrane fusion protein (multidrug efflux system)